MLLCGPSVSLTLCCFVCVFFLFFFVVFFLRGNLFYVLPCVFLFFCFPVLLALQLPCLWKRANLSVFRTFVRFVLVWICRFPLPLGVWEGRRFVTLALPGLFSYLFFFYSTRRFVLGLALCYFVLVIFSPFRIAITSLGEETANLSAFVWFILVWFCLFPLPLCVWDGLRLVIVALLRLFFFFFYFGHLYSLSTNPTPIT